MHTKLERLLSKSLTTLEVMSYYIVVHTGPCPVTLWPVVDELGPNRSVTKTTHKTSLPFRRGLQARMILSSWNPRLGERSSVRTKCLTYRSHHRHSSKPHLLACMKLTSVLSSHHLVPCVPCVVCTMRSIVSSVLSLLSICSPNHRQQPQCPGV